ncbi:50S ribosomal protein L2 [Candidatus Dojkabacteria bacterium]|nr:50S ribosomal protein L2 [Candidatus Dojkabacteria bacterium]
MIKIFKPTTQTRRHTALLDNRGLDSTTKKTKRLKKMKKGSRGKNGSGAITVRHKSGKGRTYYREIDFKRDKMEVPANVEAIEYDPNRSCNIALLKYADGERRYILAPKGVKVGQELISREKEAPIKPGNAMPLKNIPFGTYVHNIELRRGEGGKIARSAGMSVQIQGGDKKYIQLKMPSGEIRLVREENMATIGLVGNEDKQNVRLGKAGRKRHMGIRPTVRGTAQSDSHPHSGGQGKGGRHGTGGPAKTPWGKKQGTKTRKNTSTDKYIIKRRTTRRRPNVKKTRHTIV